MEHKMLSLADQVFEQLEYDILTGKYERGDTLTESALCEQLGVSRPPVREALRRLENEHLIEDTSRGDRVMGISQAGITDIFPIRQRVEPLASRWAAERGSAEGIAQLKEILSLQEFYTQKQDAENLKNMDTRFHQGIYTLSGSYSMQDTLEPLHRKLQKYRRVSLTSHERAVASLQEHQAIYEAIESHDGDKAEHLTMLHVWNAWQAIQNHPSAKEEEVETNGNA